KMTSDLSLINWQCGSSSGPASAPRSDRLAVEFRLESDHELAAAEVEHRPLDHRRLRQHQRHGLFGVEMVFVFLRKFTEAHAGAVEQRLPANFLAPSLQPLAFDPGGLVVVEGIVDAVLVQPSARLFHRLAVLDAVDGDGHAVRSVSRSVMRLEPRLGYSQGCSMRCS